MNREALQQRLTAMAERGLAHAAPRARRAVAHAILHEGFTPDLRTMPASAAREVGYLVDYLAHLGALSGARAAALQRAVAPYRPPSAKTTRVANSDYLSRTWGVSADLSRYVRALLPP